ncbi:MULTISPECIES: TIGR00153 family protein [Cellvibrio]|jgi:predicted phosphate transport protein (TIGR00153 family)|uniref:Phosphate transport protein (TIGR00153 family) n=1 Tax=Cellvibrio fibrivorans TaxID=126350 RepID=A0ABU1USV9_9GAMM|nr:TIGR00153 family protein [Cellvibrio fibrivorans]MDR7088268.1 putative phosphate transport protein (TIGR00153 family) [Cellvibrio fibrivorans]
MPFANLSNLFGRSPIKPMQEHMALAVQAAAELTRFFEAVTSDDWPRASEIQQRVVQFEHQADEIKKQLRLHLPKSLFLPVPRTDLLELLTMQDRIPNRAKDIAGIIMGRRMTIPTSMKEQVNEFVRASVAAAEQALIAINELDELLESGFSGRELAVVENMIKELDDLEEKTDHLEIGVRTSLFALEAQLPPVDVMFLYNIIDWVGDIANRAHDVGGRLQLLLAR